MKTPKKQLDGFAKGRVLATLRLEALAMLVAALLGFHAVHGRWLWFAVLFLVPDLSFLIYLINPRAGSIGYDAVHSYIGPVALLLAGFTLRPAILPLALIWIAHIALDRSVGYGLKYSTSFDHTHLGPIGQAKNL